MTGSKYAFRLSVNLAHSPSMEDGTLGAKNMAFVREIAPNQLGVDEPNLEEAHEKEIPEMVKRCLNENLCGVENLVKRLGDGLCLENGTEVEVLLNSDALFTFEYSMESGMFENKACI